MTDRDDWLEWRRGGIGASALGTPTDTHAQEKET